jgi:hypothetical protein
MAVGVLELVFGGDHVNAQVFKGIALFFGAYLLVDFAAFFAHTAEMPLMGHAAGGLRIQYRVHRIGRRDFVLEDAKVFLVVLALKGGSGAEQAEGEDAFFHGLLAWFPKQRCPIAAGTFIAMTQTPCPVSERFN